VRTDTLTLIIFLAPWAVWLAWEVVLIGLRATQPQKPKLISGVAKDLAWKLSSLVYVWCGLASHFWWTSPTWATVAGSVAFWLVLLVLLVEDLALGELTPEQYPRWMYWQRFPPFVMAAGILAGRFLFPQAGGG
jgi:hypothetical protein